MTRAKHVLSLIEGTQSTPSMDITNSKLEIRNSKQIQMIKMIKTQNSKRVPVADFIFLVFGLVCF
jgi:hypothetical protein